MVRLNRTTIPSLCLRMIFKRKTGRQLFPIMRRLSFRRVSSREPGPTSLENALIPTQHFDLPHPEHLDPWSTPRLDKAADTNPSIFERLRGKPRRLEHRHYAP
jgi:hypothetical protein